MPTKYLNKLQNKRVLIIGGTAGIGYAVAEASVEHGAIVTIASSQQVNIDNAIQTLKASYPDAANRINGHVCNIDSPDVKANLTTLLSFATSNLTHKLDHIVDTSGGGPRPLGLATVTPDELMSFVASRLNGVVMLGQLAATYLNPSYESSLTFTGGSLVYKPIAGMAVASTVAGARDTFSKGLAKELAPLRVNLVSPGAIRTGLLEKLVGGMVARNKGKGEGPSKDDIEEGLAFWAQLSLLKRVGMPEDIAEGYLSVMKNYYQTGSVIHVEGVISWFSQETCDCQHGIYWDVLTGVCCLLCRQRY